MAAFNFPASPSSGDTYTLNSVTYQYDGTKWIRYSASVGAQGNTGPTGATGAQGTQGHQGLQGAQAHISTSAPSSGVNNGDLWWESDTGDLAIYYNDGSSAQWIDINTGPRGAQGGTGPTGAQGATGSGGSTGAQGATGATGAQGATGSTGSQGATGSGGSTGAQGATGATGAQGAQGATGSTGAQGAAGSNGGTAIVNDSSPQLGGDLDVNDFDIKNGNQIYEIVSNTRHLFKSAGNTILNINGNGVDFQHGNNTHADSVKSQFGASNDLQIFHTSNENFIRGHSSASRLYIDCCEDLHVRHLDTNGANSEKMIRAVGDGTVELYYDSVKKFETLSTGNQGTGILKLISGNGSTSSDDNILHIVSGGTADRGIVVGTGRATGANQNDGMGYIDAWNSESSGYGSQIQLRVNGTRIMNIGYQSNDYVGINEDHPVYELVVAAQDTNESTLQIKAGGNGKDSNIYFGAPDDDDVGKISYDHNGDHMKFVVGTNEIMRSNSNGLLPGANNTYDLGTSSLRWANVFTTDLQLSNEGKTNDVDGTWGNYTIQEGESDLFLINNRNGKKYKFNLTEVS